VITDRLNTTAGELRNALGAILADSKTACCSGGSSSVVPTPDSDSAIPCVAGLSDDRLSSDVRNELGHFPELSWRLAVDCVSGSDTSDVYMPRFSNDCNTFAIQRREPSSIDKLSLPDEYISHAARVKRHGHFDLLTPNWTSNFRAQAPYFSEQALSEQIQAKIRKLMDTDRLPPDSQTFENETGVSCISQMP